MFINSLEKFVRADVQVCKSRKSCLRYFSKEDSSPLYNCKESELQFNLRARKWAERVHTFRFDDPFVVEHRFCYRFLKKFFDDVKSPVVDVELRPMYDAYCN